MSKSEKTSEMLINSSSRLTLFDITQVASTFFFIKEARTLLIDGTDTHQPGHHMIKGGIDVFSFLLLSPVILKNQRKFDIIVMIALSSLVICSNVFKHAHDQLDPAGEAQKFLNEIKTSVTRHSNLLISFWCHWKGKSGTLSQRVHPNK